MQHNQPVARTHDPLITPIEPRHFFVPSVFERVVVVGLGYVGLPLALLARAKGYRVLGVDIDAHKRSQIEKGDVPDLDEYSLALLRIGALDISQGYEEVKHADVVIVCVPTPVDHDHNPDLSPVIDATTKIGMHLKKGQVVILESTVHPGTCDEVVIPILEKTSGLRAGMDFGVAHCPERINPGDEEWPIRRIPRVIGATEQNTLSASADFYRSLLEASVHEMESLREAEAVKVVENAFRDINIAFVNELAMSFDKLGIDVLHVLKGASTKPFGFLPHYPGCGVGGHCIPVDPYYLIRYAKRNGFSHEFLSLARSINERMPAFTVEVLQRALNERGVPLRGAKVALLGLSYKADISDLRESPSFEIKHELEKRGARVRIFDPHTLEYSNTETLKEALTGADAAVVATAHEEFRSLTPEFFLRHGVSLVVDGRNCLPKEEYQNKGVTLRGIGR